MKRNTNKLLIIGALSSVLSLSSCTPATSQKNWNEMTANEQQEYKSEQVNDYFIKLSDWSTLSPSVLSPFEKNDRTAVKDSKKTVEEKVLVSDETGDQVASATCTTEDFDLTRTPSEVVMQNPAAGVLYPGALIQGEGYLQGPGGLRELPIRKRAPLVVATDLANENNAIQVDNVNYATFEEARAKLLKAASQNKNAKIGRALFTQVESSKSTQAALDLGFSASYMGFKASGDAEVKSTTKQHTFMVVFKQNAYTISAVAPSSPAGFFDKTFTAKELKQQESLGNISAKNPPLYVSSVTYGRILIYTITSTASKADIQSALNVTYKNAGVKLNVKLKQKYEKIMNDSKIDKIFFGGESEPSIAMIKSGDIVDYFSKTPSLESFEPISYVLRNIKDNSIAKISETTRYTKQECTPLPPKSWTVKITIDKILMHYTGATSKGEIYGKLSLNGFNVWSRIRDEYAPTKNESALEVSSSSNSITLDLLVPSKENGYRRNPVVMKGQFSDADMPIWGQDDELATFNENIGYTADGRVLPKGSYSSSHNRNVEIFYSVEIVKANY